MAERGFHLGIDYGTSMSKLVFRDYGGPGGERAFVVVEPSGFRIPSGVVSRADKLVLGVTSSDPRPEGEVQYESIKMRVAEEAVGNATRFHYGPKPPFPSGFNARDLATLTVWWLISFGHRAVEERLAQTGGGELFIGMTLGIPMSFYDDVSIRNEFLKIAKTAWRLSRHRGLLAAQAEIDLAEARKALDECKDHDVESLSKDGIRDWVRSEAEAAMWWAFQSPSVLDGPFAQVDVGAGTTNASLFRMTSTLSEGRRVKDALAFFAACSEPVGMDAIDELVYPAAGPDSAGPISLRGTEDHVIDQGGFGDRVKSFVRDKVWEAYRKCWIATSKKIFESAAERTAWGRHKVFLVGGGSLVRAVAWALPFHPSDNGHTRMQVQQLEVPNDLYMARTAQTTMGSVWNKLLGRPVFETRPQQADLPFVAVAYGLSAMGIIIPEISTPGEMPPMPPPSRGPGRLGRDDIYPK